MPAFLADIHRRFGYADGGGITVKTTPLPAALPAALTALRTAFANSADLVVREARVAGHRVAFLSIEGMVDRQILSESVILPLLQLPEAYPDPAVLYRTVRESVVGFTDLLEADTVERLAELLVSGFAAVLIHGVGTALLGGLQAFMIRGVGEPSSETGVRGSREGFTEALRVNLSLVRRRLKTPQLTFEMHTVGAAGQTAVCLCYLRNRTSPQLLRWVRRRVCSCPLDMLLDSGYLQPFLEGHRRSVFTGVDTTERPDTLCGKLAEGRVGVLVDGTPFALVVPFLFSEHFQCMDDYTQPPLFASFLRLLKYTAFVLSLLLPGAYVAVGTHHAEMLPFAFLLSLVNAARSSPFSLTVQALLIHLVFEIMREAGLRFPKSVGHAVSIAGAIVIGDAAVAAGLVSAPMVIIVALTSVSAFVLPSLYGGIAVLRLVFILLGGAFGIHGLVIGSLLLLCSTCSLEIAGIPVTAPLSPFSFRAMRDVLIRADWRTLSRRRFAVQNVVGSRIARGKEERPRDSR